MPPELSALAPDGVLDQLRCALAESLGTRRYQAWFGGATRLELCGAELVLHVPSPYLVKWLQRQFEPQLLRIAADVIGPDARVRYEIGGEVCFSPAAASSGAPALTSHPRKLLAANQTSVASPIAGQVGPVPAARPQRSRRSYSLHDFVPGESNLLALTAVHKFLEDPAAVPSLYVHSGVGNGKTHLLEGVRSRLRKEHGGLQVVLISAEQFCNYFTQALGAKSLPSFRGRFRQVDVLLVDDVDFLDGKKGFQEEFLHTVKQFESQGRQLVFTSGCHPRMLGKTSEELVSRFLAGPVCRMESPDAAQRREIASRHATRQKARLTPEALAHVADRFTVNVRELEGAVNLLATWSLMSGQAVSAAAARKLLARLERDTRRLVQVSEIDAAVTEFFGLESGLLRSASRKQAVSQPRMIAMYLTRKLTTSAYSEIGAYFGGRNHSTVISAERKIQESMRAGEALKVSAERWELEDVLRTLEDRIKAG